AHVSLYFEMTSSMAFFCAVDPSPFRVPVGHSLSAADDEAPAGGDGAELPELSSLPQALSASRPATDTRTAAERTDRSFLTDTSVIALLGEKTATANCQRTLGRTG